MITVNESAKKEIKMQDSSVYNVNTTLHIRDFKDKIAPGLSVQSLKQPFKKLVTLKNMNHTGTSTFINEDLSSMSVLQPKMEN